METLDRQEKGNFLQFVTGSSKVPIEGFDQLQGMNGPEKFQISKIITRDSMRLPQGHTCFNQLDLPEYPNKEVLQERLMWAIKETSGFGFAWAQHNYMIRYKQCIPMPMKVTIDLLLT